MQDVYLGSPAQEADFQPFNDYILGTKELTFTDLNTFAKYISVNLNQRITLYIYNTQLEKVRVCNVEPRDNWGGEGYLGADISFGFLNKLPSGRGTSSASRRGSR